MLNICQSFVRRFFGKLAGIVFYLFGSVIQMHTIFIHTYVQYVSWKKREIL